MEKHSYIHREIERKLKQYVKQFPAVALTGPRQSGKSTTLKSLFGKDYQYVTFDDPLMQQRALSDPQLFLDGLFKNVILDEIQYAPKLLSHLKMNIDKDRKTCGRYILTGSQQFHVMKNLGDSLAGRIGLLTLLPFSHKEIMGVKSARKKSTNARKAFLFHCLRGAFPELVTRPSLNPVDWYGSYVRTYLERDIRTIYNIGSLREFQRFLQVLASRCSQKLNMSSLSSDIGVSVNTIKSWISVLEASHIVTLLYPYYKSFGKRIIKNPKVYFLDSGLVCYLTGLRTEEHILNGPMAGALFENYCISETVKQAYHLGRLPNLYFLSSSNGHEMDLILEQGADLYGYEIKLSKSPTVDMAKNIERLLKGFPKLHFKKIEILCLTDEDAPLTKNITAKNVLHGFQELQA